MSAIETVTLPRVGTLKMGETIIEKDCTGEGLPIYSADKSNRPWAFSNHFKRLNKRGTIVLGARGTIGHPRLPRDEQFGATQTTITLTPDSENFQSEFVYFALQQLDFTLLGAQQAIPMLTVGNLESVTIPKFPKPEQTKIAEILSTVDRAIEQTEALIAKQQRLKTGLMQDLLTRGIDEHGNLRSEQTHEFKDSPLGRIPVEWEVKQIDELLANVDPPMRSGPFGSALLKEELVEAGIPLLGIDNVHTEKFVEHFTRFVHPKKAETLKRYYVRPGDIMITIMGTVGRCCVVPDNIGTALSSKHTWTISLDQTVYSPYLACLQINHAPWVLNHFAKDEQGGIMSSIKSDTLRSTQLPVPPRDELMEIEVRMKSLTDDYEIKAELLSNLRALKTALMQDLLTGRKRVTKLLTNNEIEKI